MKCIIVDDEPQARKLLHTYLDDIAGCDVVRTCRNAVEAYETLQSHKVDLLFLDVKMPLVSGIEFLRSLKNPPLVVFTTAFDKYAIQGYELNVVDYLLKPIVFARLLHAIEKAKERLKPITKDIAIDTFAFIRVDNRMVKLIFSEIAYVESMQNYVKIHLVKGELIVYSTMKAFEDLLPTSLFVRIHRSYIVPLDGLIAVRANFVELKSIELPVGSSYRDQLMKRLGLSL